MKRCRIIFEGKALGFIAVKWTIATNITIDQLTYAQWLFGWLNGQKVSAGSVLKGTVAVTITNQ